MLLIVENRIRGGICHAIHRYAKANNKYFENDDKNKESSYIQMQTISIDGKCLKNCLQMVLNAKNTLNFNEGFIKDYDEDSDKGYIFEINVEYPKYSHDLHSDFTFLP